MLVSAFSFLTGCGNKGSLSTSCEEENNPQYVGTYLDEYGNLFVLNDNHTATIQLANSDNIHEETWKEHHRDGCYYTTISFNGNPAYYYLHDGYLFCHLEDMESLRSPIVITKKGGQ